METFKPVGPRCLKTMSLGSYFDSTAILMICYDMKDCRFAMVVLQLVGLAIEGGMISNSYL